MKKEEESEKILFLKIATKQNIFTPRFKINTMHWEDKYDQPFSCSCDI